MFSSQNLGLTPTSSDGETYCRVGNASALISRCTHFDSGGGSQKPGSFFYVVGEEVGGGESTRRKMKFNFLPRVGTPKRINGHSNQQRAKRGGGADEGVRGERDIEVSKGHLSVVTCPL